MLAPLILVVEDDPDTHAAIASILLENGFRVVEAWTGPDAVHLARRHQPDLVLLDLGLPGMNGLDVAQLLNDDPLGAATPIVALTGSWLAANPAALCEAGFMSALRKPFRALELLSKVRTALRSRGWIQS